MEEKRRLWNSILEGNFMQRRINFYFFLLPKYKLQLELHRFSLLNKTDVKCIFSMCFSYFSITGKNLSLVLLLSPLLENMFAVMLYACGVALDSLSNIPSRVLELLLEIVWEIQLWLQLQLLFDANQENQLILQLLLDIVYEIQLQLILWAK